MERTRILLEWLLFVISCILCTSFGSGEGFSLVMHHFAPPKVVHPHYTEVEAAIVANICSDVFHEIHIIYEVSNVDNCKSLLARLDSLLDQTMLALGTKDRPLTKVQCVEVFAQATYPVLFGFAFMGGLNITTSRVVLSNADCVFDETLHVLTDSTPGAVNVISVKGFPPLDQLSTSVYLAFHPLLTDIEIVCRPEKVVNRCNSDPRESFSWPTNLPSWDAYVVHLPTNISFDNLPGPVYMNELQGEMYAACSFQDRSRIHNACKWVNLWHFHCADKMHRSAQYASYPMDVCPGKYRGCKRLYQCF